MIWGGKNPHSMYVPTGGISKNTLYIPYLFGWYSVLVQKVINYKKMDNKVYFKANQNNKYLCFVKSVSGDPLAKIFIYF